MHDLFYTPECVLQYVPQNLIITNGDLPEYAPRYVVEYIPISYCRTMLYPRDAPRILLLACEF